MKTLLTFSIASVLLLTNFVCQPLDIRKGMVQFDQAFLPVLMHTRQGDMNEAKKAVFYLDFQWQRLRNQYEFSHTEHEWREAFRQINEHLGKAYQAIDANQPALALWQLESVRQEWTNLRTRYRIDYYLDYLYDFQEAADLLTETATDEMLCLQAWEDLEKMAAETAAAWQEVRYYPLDADLYELDADKIELLRARMQTVAAVLQNMEKAIETADRAQVAAVCTRLQPAFLKVLWVFGNDNASTTYYARNRAHMPDYHSLIQN
ncbi:MAG TPA: hypothetical protein PKC76_05845 [Saprospiraceae bacterium]|nr:hypothetical protein [Saprospiraceae bacterium]HMP23633.1 hypothetical protein [Saprospiraceae bacterium]